MLHASNPATTVCDVQWNEAEKHLFVRDEKVFHMGFLHDVIIHHTSKIMFLKNSEKSSVLLSSHVLKKHGLFENVEMTMSEYHIRFEGPCLPHWPKGAWSVYAITGDQIADRVIREEVVPADKANFGVPFYKGKVIARHSWCGYLGLCETFEGVQKMIDKHMAQAKVA